MSRRALNLGCGPGPQPGTWVHVDGSWNAWLSRYRGVRPLLARLRVVSADAAALEWTPGVMHADLRKPLPFGDASYDAVYASHVLEHLYEDEARRLLQECYRVLGPGGVIRLVVPDLRSFLTTYLSAAASAQERAAAASAPADRLMQDLHLRPRCAPSGGLAFRLYSILADLHSHKWLYDAQSLTERLRTAGFTDVEERGYLESRIDGLQEVERRERVVGGAGICVEGIKPSR